MAAIISWQFIGLPASASTRAAASRALVFLAVAFSAWGAFLALVGLGFRDAALFCVSVLAAVGIPLASGGGWSLPSLFLVVLFLAVMSGLPKWWGSDASPDAIPFMVRRVNSAPPTTRAN